MSAFQNYETIAGGSGAGPGFDGAPCVQVHMTNTSATDPEVLETRFPVRVERMAHRRGLRRPRCMDAAAKACTASCASSSP
jgi:5-oxoprolinase (ATP-hydrolysing)